MFDTVVPGGCGMPSPVRKRSKRLRSSARSMASADDPRIGCADAVSGPARLIAVCPPNCRIEGTASRSPSAPPPAPASFSSMSSADSSSSGSKYSRSDVSKSVETVSGLLLAMIAA